MSGSYEDQGTGYDPGAAGYERQGRATLGRQPRAVEAYIGRECQALGHEFAYEPNEEPGECPPHCIHCGAEDPDYPWHALDALKVRP